MPEIPRTAKSLQITDAILLLKSFPIPYCFISPTDTGLAKSIMDATGQVRDFLALEGIHDYSNQKQGSDYKAVFDGYFVTTRGLVPTKVSLYRPLTKRGDPRIWFSHLGKYAVSGDLLVLFSKDKSLCILNLSSPQNVSSLLNAGTVFQELENISDVHKKAKAELLARLEEISCRGWIPATGSGDFAVGDTLENALGIARNNLRSPDYKGIELKSKRTVRDGIQKSGRTTLFTKTPDKGMSYREIVSAFGREKIDKKGKKRLGLYDTISSTKTDSFGLRLYVNEVLARVELRYVMDAVDEYVSSWSFKCLRDAAATKHHETMFVDAESKTISGKEYLHFVSATYTNKPNILQLPALIEKGIITVDIAGHLDLATGKWRDHGMLWRVLPHNLIYFVGESERYTF